MRGWSLLSYSAVLILMSGTLAAQSLSGPPKPDVPFLVHAANLIETQQAQATEEERGNELRYVIPGTESGVKTPLAGPEFLFRPEKLAASDLRLFRMEASNGRREILFRRKNKVLAEPLRLSVVDFEEGVVKIRVDESLSAGEYCLTPDGSNSVFCFTVY